MKQKNEIETPDSEPTSGRDAATCSVVYEPLRLMVDEQVMLNIWDNLRDGLEYMRESLTDHDNALGRTTKKNKCVAEMIESDIRKTQASMNWLARTWPNNFILPNVKFTRSDKSVE